MKYKIIKDICICASIIFSFNLSIASEMEEDVNSLLPFKLGLEFQIVNQACVWAKTRPLFLKKELFSLSTNNKEKLWHVVIDDGDIEFVLPPFNSNQEELLQTAIDSLLIAIKPITIRNLIESFDEQDLNHALKNKSNISSNKQVMLLIAGTLKEKRSREVGDQNPYFRVWKNYIQQIKEYSNLTTHDIEELWDRSDTSRPMVLNTLFNQGKNELQKVTFCKWIEEIESLIANQNLSLEKSEFYLTYENLFKQENFSIQCFSELKIQPQATIQHPLNYTIPLMFNLFGYNIFTLDKIEILNKHHKFIDNFISCLPYLHDFNKGQLDRMRLCEKEIGLVFLHGLTLKNMMFINSNSVNLINDIKESYAKGQIDAKRLQPLMSRRPFSEMWKEVKSPKHYSEVFNEALIESNELYNLFHKNIQTYSLNHGEQFIHEDHFKNLTVFKEKFTLIFLEEIRKNSLIDNMIEDFLKNGVILTEMIRNLDPETISISSLQPDNCSPSTILNNFYNQAIESLEHPYSRWVFKILDEGKGPTITLQGERYNYDVLSPPFLLHDDNSMGLMKDNEILVKEYGEAIVEVRFIKFAFPQEFLNFPYLTSFNSIKNKNNEDIDFKDQVMFLFNFLKQFSNKIV